MTTTKTPVGIRAQGLTKRYGDKVAVDDLSFTAEPGVITGFLGPNGAGKSTTMRMLLGLVKPTRGTITIGGRHIAELAEPARTVGALLTPGHCTSGALRSTTSSPWPRPRASAGSGSGRCWISSG
jgi:ABC-2 type transport system ATP-binding protein